MSQTVSIASGAQFGALLKSSNIVITDFYADWCGPCKQISPIFEGLSAKHSKKNSVTFTKVNVDNQQSIAQQYGVTAMPTFIVFRSGKVLQTLRGADPRGLTSAVENAVKAAATMKQNFSYNSPGHTLGGSSARPGQSLQQPLMWKYDIKAWISAIYTFLGLYFISLFSVSRTQYFRNIGLKAVLNEPKLDPYASAANSPFNIHREPPKPAAPVLGKGSARAGLPVPKERKVGTLSDITGDS